MRRKQNDRYLLSQILQALINNFKMYLYKINVSFNFLIAGILDIKMFLNLDVSFNSNLTVSKAWVSVSNVSSCPRHFEPITGDNRKHILMEENHKP